jgi:plasmid rolling circle replication initiator protein Rep
LILDNEVIKVIQDKKNITSKYSGFYYVLDKKFMDNKKIPRFEKKAERMKNCLDMWIWDKYEKNKILDLLKVNRCMNYRFCPNCRTLHLAKQLHKFSPHFKKYLDEGYLPFLMTLTIPNISGDELSSTITRMGTIFKKFWTRFHNNDHMGFKGRYVDFVACVRILEITVQKTDNNMYHPHFHCMVFIKSDDYYNSNHIFHKSIPGAWSNKHNSQLFNSLLDIQIAKLWYLFYNDMKIKDYYNLSDNIFDLYQCDIRECELPNGLFEVFKYTFKDTDIKTFDNFETLVFAMRNKRLMTTHGLLYKLNLEEVDDEGKKIDLQDFIVDYEDPEQVITKEINTLTTVYNEYTKISRFSAHKHLKDIQEKE